jgi:hypothetical protein
MEETGSLVTPMALASHMVRQEEESRWATHQDHNTEWVGGKKRGEEGGQRCQSEVPSQVVFQDLQGQEVADRCIVESGYGAS